MTIATGVGKKLLSNYHPVPCICIKTFSTGGYFQNIVTSQISRRHFDHVKYIPVDTDFDQHVSAIPAVLKNKLFLLTSQDMEDFPYYNDVLNDSGTKVITRNAKKKLEKLTKIMDEDVEHFLNDFDVDLDDDEVNKHVHFE